MPALSNHSRALILPGGGARAAYQVGVLKAISEMLEHQKQSPFRIYSGTSAGAINAAVLAAHAGHYKAGMRRLESVWNNFTVQQVYRTDALTVLKNSAHWLWTIFSAGRFGRKPTSFLDCEPLRNLLQNTLQLECIQDGLDKKHIDGLVVFCSAYSTAQSVSFYQARKEQQAWQRFRRVGIPAEISVEHLMASSAIPYVFPAIRIGEQYYGDGAVRQAKPLSAALHLGAERLLVIGVRDEEPNHTETGEVIYPSLGRIAGYILDTLFMDGLFSDIEHLLHVNSLLENIDTAKTKDKPVACQVIVPSCDIREIALRHQHHLPRSMRLFMAGVGGSGKLTGSQLVSYLLFDQHYTRDLIALGYADAKLQRDQLMDFFCAEEIPTLVAPQLINDRLEAHSKL